MKPWAHVWVIVRVGRVAALAASLIIQMGTPDLDAHFSPEIGLLRPIIAPYINLLALIQVLLLVRPNAVT